MKYRLINKFAAGRRMRAATAAILSLSLVALPLLMDYFHQHQAPHTHIAIDGMLALEGIADPVNNNPLIDCVACTFASTHVAVNDAGEYLDLRQPHSRTIYHRWWRKHSSIFCYHSNRAPPFQAAC